jgi:hypothetical protein
LKCRLRLLGDIAPPLVIDNGEALGGNSTLVLRSRSPDSVPSTPTFPLPSASARGSLKQHAMRRKAPPSPRHPEQLTFLRQAEREMTRLPLPARKFWGGPFKPSFGLSGVVATQSLPLSSRAACLAMASGENTEARAVDSAPNRPRPLGRRISFARPGCGLAAIASVVGSSTGSRLFGSRGYVRGPPSLAWDEPRTGGLRTAQRNSFIRCERRYTTEGLVEGPP